MFNALSQKRLNNKNLSILNAITIVALPNIKRSKLFIRHTRVLKLVFNLLVYILK